MTTGPADWGGAYGAISGNYGGKSSPNDGFMSDIGGLISDVIGNVTTGLKDLFGLVTDPVGAVAEAGKTAAKEVAQPVTSVVDAWLPGEPIQDAWESYVDKTAGRISDIAKDVGDSFSDTGKGYIDQAAAALGVNVNTPEGTGGEVKRQVNELIKDIKQDIKGNKETYKPPTPKKKKRKTTSQNRRKGRSYRKPGKVTVYN